MKLILILLLSASCSFKSLIVSKLDYLMTSKIAGELNLNDQQEDELRVDVKKFLNQNKETAKLLKKKISKLDVNSPIPIEGLKEQYIEITNRLMPLITKYYFKLSVEQKKEFFKLQEEKNESVEEQADEMTVKTVAKKYDGFFGYINDGQRELIRSNLPLLKDISKQRINRRLKIQRALKKAKTYEQVESAFALFTKSLNENNELNERFFKFLSQMITNTNKDQKETLKEKKIELVQILEYYITNSY